jgi:hypothetical protein
MPTTMCLRTGSHCPPSQSSFETLSQPLVLIHLSPASRLTPDFPCLSHLSVDRYLRQGRTHLCINCSQLHPFLPDNIPYLPSRILYRHLSPAFHHLFLSLTVARVPQSRRRFHPSIAHPSIANPSSRRRRSLIVLSDKYILTLLHHPPSRSDLLSAPPTTSWPDTS